VVRERLKELVDFATTESPYRDANKGWVTEDIYIQFGASREKSSRGGQELANVSVYWSPINQLVSIIFVVVSLAAVFVFVSVSFAHGRLQIPIDTTSDTTQRSEIVLKESVKQGISAEVIQEAAPVAEKQNEQEKVKQEIGSELTQEAAPVAGKQNEQEKVKQNNDFAAAALGGRKFKS